MKIDFKICDSLLLSHIPITCTGPTKTVALIAPHPVPVLNAEPASSNPKEEYYLLPRKQFWILKNIPLKEHNYGGFQYDLCQSL